MCKKITYLIYALFSLIIVSWYVSYVSNSYESSPISHEFFNSKSIIKNKYESLEINNDIYGN